MNQAGRNLHDRGSNPEAIWPEQCMGVGLAGMIETLKVSLAVRPLRYRGVEVMTIASTRDKATGRRRFRSVTLLVGLCAAASLTLLAAFLFQQDYEATLKRAGAYLAYGDSRLCFADPEISEDDFRRVLHLVAERFQPRAVSLENSRLSDSAMKELLVLEDSILTLWLANAHVTNGALSAIAELDNLAYLDLTNTRITDEGLNALAGRSRLKVLLLTRTDVTDVGMASIGRMQTLQVLALDGTRIRDAGLKHIQFLTGLEELSLANTSITDSGMVHLAPLVNLEKLSLEGTQITDAGLKVLIDHTHLRSLDLDNTQVTAKGIGDLRSHLPNVVIYFGSSVLVPER
jgi:hypothetical protein